MKIDSMLSVRAVLISLLVVLLSACDPAFKTTSELCAADGDVSVFQRVQNFDVEADSDEYRLYLQDIFRAIQFNDGDGFTDDPDGLTAAEKQEVFDNILAIINRDDFFDYELKTVTDADGNEGDAVKSSNPLDFLEALISTTDSGEVIDLFDSIRRQLLDGINSDDDYCNYSNRNIEIESIDTGETLFGEINLSYDPFTEIVQQTVLLTNVRAELDSGFDRAEIPFVGFYQADPAEFKRSGYIQPYLRQAIIQNDDNDETLLVDDGFDNFLGQVEFNVEDSYCAPVDDEDNPSNFGDCPTDGSVVVRTVERSECEQDPTEEEPDLINETNKRKVKTFSLGSHESVQDLKRFRLEADYENAEVRIYVSKYTLNGIVQDENATQLTSETALGDRLNDTILEPTNCEKQAIIDAFNQKIEDDEAEVPPGGILLRQVADRNYDIDFELDAEGERVQDEDGNDIEIEPTPLFTFTGLTLPERQPTE